MNLDEALVQSSFGKFEDLLTDAHVYHTLKTNCAKNIEAFLKSDTMIWRGYENNDDMTMQVFHGGRMRHSLNAKNYYTLLMDNLPSWKGYPKRSESLICTTHQGSAHDFGTPRMMIPFDTTIVGVCSQNDLWASFPRVFDNWELSTMGQFDFAMESLNDYIGKLRKALKLAGPVLGSQDFDDSWNQLSGQIAKWTKLVSQISPAQLMRFGLTDYGYTQTTNEDVTELCMKKFSCDFMMFLNWLMNPVGNMFQKGFAYNCTQNFGTDVEVWFSGPCVILHEGYDLAGLFKK